MGSGACFKGMKKFSVPALLFALLVSLSLTGSARAEITWDSSFGIDGRALIEDEPNLGGYMVPTLGGGAYIGSASFVRVARVSRRGELVESYGRSGVAEISDRRFPGIQDVTAMSKDRQGRVLMVGDLLYPRTGGQVTSTFFTRFTREGLADKSFGGDGLTLRSKQRGYNKPDLEPLPDGGFVVSETSNNQAFVSAFLANGKPDRSFGKNGRFSFKNPREGTSYAGGGIERLPSGKLIVAVEVWGPESTSLRLIRLRANGRPDRSFGKGRGWVLVARAPFEGFDDIQIGVTSSRIRVLVKWLGQRQYGFTAFSRKMDGSKDRSYGVKGRLALTAKRLRDSIVVGNGFSISDARETATFQRDGGILVGLYYPARPLIFRITASGRLDRNFAESGVFTAPNVKERLDAGIFNNGDVLGMGTIGEDLAVFRFRSP
jgi:hypothetical protein